MYRNKNNVIRFFIITVSAIALAGCGGGGSSNKSNESGTDTGTDSANTPNVINGFDLAKATLTLSGPTTVGTGSVSQYTATLLDSNGVPPASPPGVPIELSVSAGSTNPPGSSRTDNNGQVNFTFRAPNNGNQAVVRARVRNRDGDFVLNQGITVNAQENVFQFTTPPENTQVRAGAAREIRLNWLIGNTGVSTGSVTTGNPSAVQLTLEGRSAGGGFRIGGAGPVQDPATVNVSNGKFSKTVEVVAGDAGGPVNVVATASNGSQALRDELALVFVGTPARIDPTPTNIRLQQQESTPLNVRVFDQKGAPLSNIPLRFNISICIDDQRNTTACTGSGEQITSELRTTDSTGRASTGFIAGDGIGGGEIEMTVDSGPGKGLERAIVYNVTKAEDTGGTGGGMVATTETFNAPADGTQIPVGQSRTVVLNVSNANGPVANQAVTFNITRGVIDDDPNAAPAPAASRTFTSNGAGNIIFQISSSEAGPATLSSGSAQLNLEFTQPPQALNSITTTAANATITPGATNTITATARDSNNNPLPSTPLQFVLATNTPDGSIAPTNGTTDAQGQLATTFTAGNSTGPVSIRAANSDGSISSTTNFNVASGSNTQFANPANNAKIPTTQREDVKFVLPGGPAAAGQQVTFTTNRGLIDDDFQNPPAATTSRTFTADSNGVINFGILSFDAGQATLKASGAASAQLQLQFVPVGRIDNQANPQTPQVGQTSTITATTFDGNNNVLPGVLVNFVIDFDGSGGASVSPTQVKSNNQGQAITTFTAGANGGTVQLRAANGNQSVSDTVTITVQAAASGSSAQFGLANGSRLATNQSFSRRFTLDSGTAGAGQQVQLTTTLGTVDDPGNPGPAASRTFTANSNGSFLYTLSSTQAGSATITASGATSAQTQVQYVSANAVSVTADPQSLQRSQTSVITATITDANNQPVPGASVTFAIDSSTSTGGTLRKNSATATDQGVAKTSFTAGNTPGNVVISATSQDGSNASGTITLNVQ